MVKTVLKISYIFIPLIIVLIFFVDLFSFYSGITIKLVAYLRELTILGIIFVSYYLIKKKLHFDELTIGQNLVRLAILIGANFLIAIILKAVFNANYSAGFPATYQTPGSIFVSTIMAFTAAVTLVPIIFILKQLIFYKRKRKTLLFFNFFLLAISLNAIAVFLSEKPVGFFRFTQDTFGNDFTMALAVVFITILSFRNEWITYLSRKKKLIYFFVGLPLYFGIAALFDFAYRTPLPAYSLSIAALAYSMWIFLIIYGGISMSKLLFHLPTARAFDRKIRELNSLYDLGRMLNNETQIKKLLPLITRLTSQVLESHSTWLGLYDEKTKQFQVVSSDGLSEKELQNNPLLGMERINLAVIDKKEPILINDVSHNRQYRDILKWKKNARTILCSPLFSSREKLMGIIYATKEKEYTFDIDDQSLLQGFSNQAAMAMENARLLQESIERERLEQELRVARDVQIKLLPQKIPQMPNFQIEALCLTAFEVGGDYYDFFNFSDGNPGLIVADVSGKGTSAALYMAEFKGIIQTLAKSHENPHSLACAANRVIYPNIERRSFVSAILAKINPDDKMISFVRAGHPPLFHCPGNNHDPHQILSSGIGIGLDPGDKFDALLKEESVKIQDGGTIVFYTDGVIEARNAQGDEYSEERLMELARECNSDSVGDLKNRILDSVTDFCGKTPLHDDLTFVIVKCLEPNMETNRHVSQTGT